MDERKIMIPVRKDDPFRPVYHASVPSGWGNDPNGLCFFRGAFHMFYQYNPYDTVWGPMHWGHMASTDLIHWEDLPVALFPDMPFDRGAGCFSGSALVFDERLYVIYTGVGEDGSQQQCMACSSDGITFVKYDEPVIGSDMLPEGAPRDDFRDPKLFFRDGAFRCLVGTRIGEKGNIALYRSEDLKSFSLTGMLFPEDGCGIPMEGICECPDIHAFGGEDLLIFSPQRTYSSGDRFQNPQSTVYMSGKLDLCTGRFCASRWDEIDSGSDFYAAQAADLPDGRCVMFAWKEMWGRTMPTSARGWAGSYILPRELTVLGGRLIQTPAGEAVERFERMADFSDIPIPEGVSVSPEGVRGNVMRLRASLAPGECSACGIRLLVSGKDHVAVYYDVRKKILFSERGSMGIHIGGNDADTCVRRSPARLKNGVLELDIFLDRGSMEIFINGGERTLTMNVYPRDSSSDGIEFFSVGGDASIRSLEMYLPRG